MNLEQVRQEIMLATLHHVACNGWTKKALDAGTTSAGYDHAMRRCAFPRGVTDVIKAFNDWADQQTIVSVDQEGFKMCSRTHQKIGFLINQRFLVLQPYKAAVCKMIHYFALPIHARIATRTMYATVDRMWYALEDKSTDFSYYSKRATLATIIALSTLYWLNLRREDQHSMQSFIDNTLYVFGKTSKVLTFFDVTYVFKAIHYPIKLFSRFRYHTND